jgi:alcohol dehydrogenase (cytochrome c)
MKRTSLALAAVFAFSLWGPVTAQSLDDLKNDQASPGDVLTYGMGYGQQRYSSLLQINRDNVKSLVPVWAYSLADTQGNEGFPLIKDGVMYATSHNATVALDARTGRQLWKIPVDYPAETPRVVCCGIVNRGAAIFEGKLYRGTLDAHVIALDAASGKEIWRTKSIDFKDGYSFTGAPLVADGIVMIGVSGADYGVRGFVEGYDAQTGKRLWRTYIIPEPGEPGSETWKGGGDAWKRGGGGAWITGSYDPELNVTYWGTSNAAPYNAAVRPGDNLFTSSVLAIDPRTGAIKWHYQFSPNDPFDYDSISEMVLADVDGKKVLIHADKNGFLYVIDRTSGEPIAANTFVDDVNWADRIDLETGRPVVTDVYKNAVAGQEVTVYPSAFGAKNWSPMAYSPESNLVFINTLKIGMKIKAVEPQYRAGTLYLGVELAMVHAADGVAGETRAMNPMTGEVVWKNSADIPRYGGLLSTAGGLVFSGAQTGEFEALDAKTGKTLWSFQTGSGVIGQPITWEMDGRQYVTVPNGGGAGYALFAGDERMEGFPPGAGIWTFALSEN